MFANEQEMEAEHKKEENQGSARQNRRAFRSGVQEEYAKPTLKITSRLAPRQNSRGNAGTYIVKFW